MLKEFWKLWKETRAKNKRRRAFNREIVNIKSLRRIFRISPCDANLWKVEFRSYYELTGQYCPWQQLGVFSSQLDAQNDIRKAIKLHAEMQATKIIEAERRYYSESKGYIYPDRHSYDYAYNSALSEQLDRKRREYADTLSPTQLKDYYDGR